MYHGLVFALLKMQMREAEERADQKVLEILLECAPAERHAQIREEQRLRIKEREHEREVERRHQELCAAIKSVRDPYRPRYYF